MYCIIDKYHENKHNIPWRNAIVRLAAVCVGDPGGHGVYLTIHPANIFTALTFTFFINQWPLLDHLLRLCQRWMQKDWMEYEIITNVLHFREQLHDPYWVFTSVSLSISAVTHVGWCCPWEKTSCTLPWLPPTHPFTLPACMPHSLCQWVALWCCTEDTHMS